MSGEAPDGAVDVVVCVVTWNSADVLPGLLESLTAAVDGLTHHLVVADNASADATRELAGSLRPDATLIPMPGNLGYAAGINAAVAAAPSGSSYLLVNPDVRLLPGSVSRLQNALQIEGTGIAVPRLLSQHGRLQPSLRRDPTVLRALGEALIGGERAGRFRYLGEMVTDPRCYNESHVVDWATGAVLLCSAECLSRVGAWDESFFLYSEETDFAIRTRAIGLTVRYEPTAVAVHLGGEAHVSSDLYGLMVRNKVRLFRRCHGRPRSTAFLMANLLSLVLRVRRPVSRAALREVLKP